MLLSNESCKLPQFSVQGAGIFDHISGLTLGTYNWSQFWDRSYDLMFFFWYQFFWYQTLTQNSYLQSWRACFFRGERVYQNGSKEVVYGVFLIFLILLSLTHIRPTKKAKHVWVNSASGFNISIVFDTCWFLWFLISYGNPLWDLLWFDSINVTSHEIKVLVPLPTTWSVVWGY